MVVDGESIAFDASTTALAVARHLRARGSWVHLTVITNGLRIAQELAGIPGITVAMPGGFVCSARLKARPWSKASTSANSRPTAGSPRWSASSTRPRRAFPSESRLAPARRPFGKKHRAP